VPARFSEDFNHQLASTVDDVRLELKTGGTIHIPSEFDDPYHPVEITPAGLLDLSQHIERDETSGLLPLFDSEALALTDLTSEEELTIHDGHLSRHIDKVTGAHTRHIVRRWSSRGGKLNPKLSEASIDTTRHRTS